MKYLIFTLALISAFFVSAEPDMSDLVSPKQVSTGTCGLVTDINSIINDSDGDSCVEYITGLLESDPSIKRIDNVWLDGEAVMFSGKTSYETTFRVGIFRVNSSTPTCPPDSHPNHIISVGEGDSLMCAKEFVPPPKPDPNAKCDEFGNNSMLPPKSGVGQEGQTACYTNPTTGLQCQYKQGHDNFIATGKTCDGDENDYGDKPTPEPPPDGADDNCYNYGSQGQVLICDVDPNEGCNPIIVSGQQQYQCPAGCGSMDGVYFCTYDDKDGDGIPDDKNGNCVPDNDETCENGKCTPNRPDDNTTPTPETPDMTQTNTRLDSVIGELDSIGGNIRKTNQTLDGINSGIQGIKQGQDKSNGLLSGVEKNTKLTSENTDVIAGNTKGILDTLSETDVVNNFNPDSSSSFYESSYENGFTGIWEEKSVLFEQTETIQFLQQFKFNAGGSPPDTQICFNLGGTMDFGCAELPTPSPQLLAILKIFILITAAFLCRALIFGG